MLLKKKCPRKNAFENLLLKKCPTKIYNWKKCPRKNAFKNLLLKKCPLKNAFENCYWKKCYFLKVWRVKKERNMKIIADTSLGFFWLFSRIEHLNYVILENIPDDVSGIIFIFHCFRIPRLQVLDLHHIIIRDVLLITLL